MSIESPIPLSEIESVLAWVDSFKLSRSNKKINRDFSDAVLLAEILSIHYPKLVEMHNYPPRNSHALKLNNWMTLNRKVLRKLKLNLCCGTMEQLANSTPGVIERVLVMVRDKIHRDEELNKSVKDSEQNMSSGGSYYEACGDDEHVLVIPVKTRVNGVLETVQQKVVSYESYTALKEELRDAKDSSELLKQKVEHLDSLLKLKDERIDELQNQLERKQARRKEAEALQNSLAVPFETVPPPVITEVLPSRTASKAIDVKLMEEIKPKPVTKNIDTTTAESKVSDTKIIVEPKPLDYKLSFDVRPPKDESKIPVLRAFSKPSITEVTIEEVKENLDRIKSDVFKEVEIIEKTDSLPDVDEFKDSVEAVVTIEDTIDNELQEITSDDYA
ncbi:sperm flagellar protein 1-like [Plodia interpunctella]|uniref:sperm flagellar protein 1-like n=1 Tax=Plodia interpunctella TaxID=58824 RepID=UPI002368D376|nr:sperm flagellar protein 1-like [Plodia interpunctella]